MPKAKCTYIIQGEPKCFCLPAIDLSYEFSSVMAGDRVAAF